MASPGCTQASPTTGPGSSWRCDARRARRTPCTPTTPRAGGAPRRSTSTATRRCMFNAEEAVRPDDPSAIWVVSRWAMLRPSDAAPNYRADSGPVVRRQVQQVVPPSDAEATALVEAFLQARVDGEGAEQYLSPATSQFLPPVRHDVGRPLDDPSSSWCRARCGPAAGGSSRSDCSRRMGAPWSSPSSSNRMRTVVWCSCTRRWTHSTTS